MTDQAAVPTPSSEAVEAATVQAQAGATPKQAEAAASQVEQQRAELTDAEVKKISAGIVDELDERGMFEHEPSTPPTAVAAPAAEPAASAAVPAAATSSSVDEPPKKTSWAAKFLKDKGEN